MRNEVNRTQRLRRSEEDYLEMMVMLEEERGIIRSVDIAERLNVTRPSVSYATKRLREDGHITMDDDGEIHLTASGRDIAEQVYERHKTLTDMLISLGVDPEQAREDACNIEHDISEVSYQAIVRHVAENLKQEAKD